MSDVTGVKFGTFELINEIPGDSRGGQGSVYVAQCTTALPELQDVRPGDQVALKLMPVIQDEGGKLFHRLQERVAILKTFQHPGIVRYYGCFLKKELAHYYYVVVTEYLLGKTIKQRVVESLGGLDAPEAFDICCQCLDALCFAKKHGIVHRDISPSNIFLCHDGTVKLIDFEAAKNQLSTDESTTTDMVGKVQYMAPELFSGAKVNWEQADIFSLALCFHEFFTKKIPYTHGAVSQTQGKVNISDNIRALIYGLDDVLTKALEIDPADRYKSFEAFAADFKALKVTEWQGTVHSYQALQFIGKGGFGSVFKARRISDGMLVAVKCLLDPAAKERFSREAKILKAFDDSRIVKFVDYFEENNSLSRYGFLVMDYLPGMPGSSLRDRLKAIKRREHGLQRGLPCDEVFQAFLRYAEGLALLHSQNVFHRDLKPGNLYLPEGKPENACIMDLGVARKLDFESITQQHVPGTPDYMAPELARDERGSSASDIYALGLCFYEALAGDLPIPRLSKAGHIHAWATYFERAKNPPIPEFKDPIILSYKTLFLLLEGMTQPDPKRRISDISEVVRTLNHLVYRHTDTTAEHTRTTCIGVDSKTQGGDDDGLTEPDEKPDSVRLANRIEATISSPPPPNPKPLPSLQPPPKRQLSPTSRKKRFRNPFRWLAASLLLLLVVVAGEALIRRWPQVSSTCLKVVAEIEERRATFVLTKITVPLLCRRIEKLDRMGERIVVPEDVPEFVLKLKNTRAAVWEVGELLDKRKVDVTLQWKDMSFSDWTNRLESRVAELPYDAPKTACANAVSAYKEKKIIEGDTWRDEYWATWTNCLPENLFKNQKAELDLRRAEAVEKDTMSVFQTALGAYRDNKPKEGDAYFSKSETYSTLSKTNKVVLGEERSKCLSRLATNIVEGVKRRYNKVDMSKVIPIEDIEKEWEKFLKDFKPADEVKSYGDKAISGFRKRETDKKEIWDALEEMCKLFKPLLDTKDLEPVRTGYLELAKKVQEAKNYSIEHTNAIVLLDQLVNRLDASTKPVHVRIHESGLQNEVRVNISTNMGIAWEMVTPKTTLAPGKNIEIRFMRPDYKSQKMNATVLPIEQHVIHIPDKEWVVSDNVTRLIEFEKIIQQARNSASEADWKRARDHLNSYANIKFELEQNQAKWTGLMNDVGAYWVKHDEQEIIREEVLKYVSKIKAWKEQIDNKGTGSDFLSNTQWPGSDIKKEKGVMLAAAYFVDSIQRWATNNCQDEPFQTRSTRIQEVKAFMSHPNSQKIVALAGDKAVASSFDTTKELVDKSWNTFLVCVANKNALQVTLSLNGQAKANLMGNERTVLRTTNTKSPHEIVVEAQPPGYKQQRYDIHPVQGGVTNLVVASFVPLPVSVAFDCGGDTDVRVNFKKGKSGSIDHPFGKAVLDPGHYAVEFRKPGYIMQTVDFVIAIGDGARTVKPREWEPVWVPVEFVSPRNDDGDHDSVSILLKGGVDNVHTNMKPKTCRLRIGRYSAIFSRKDSVSMEVTFTVGETDQSGLRVTPASVWQPLPSVLRDAENQALAYRDELRRYLLDKECYAFQYDVVSGGKRTKLDIADPQKHKPQIKAWIVASFTNEMLKTIVGKEASPAADVMAGLKEGVDKLKEIHHSARFYLEEDGYKSLYSAVLNPLYELKTAGFPLNKYDIALAKKVCDVTQKWRDDRRVPAEIAKMDTVLDDMRRKLKVIQEQPINNGR
jgi:serine/threonine protein kinase